MKNQAYFDATADMHFFWQQCQLQQALIPVRQLWIFLCCGYQHERREIRPGPRGGPLNSTAACGGKKSLSFPVFEECSHWTLETLLVLLKI